MLPLCPVLNYRLAGQMYKWLGYSNLPASLPDGEGKMQAVEEQPDFFQKREFSFTIEDDVYIR